MKKKIIPSTVKILYMGIKTIYMSIVVTSAIAAIYGLVYVRYSIELTSLWNRVNNLSMQAESTAKALQKVSKLQSITVPHQPSVDPRSIYYSFFEKYNQKNKDIITELQELIAHHKDNLSFLNLRYINLEYIDQSKQDLRIKIDLTKANFQSSDLTAANFTKNTLMEANFNNASLFGSKFDKTYLQKANLCNADLWGTSFYKANLREANLRGTIVDHTNFTDALLVGTNLLDTNITSKPVFFKGARYNSKKISLGKVLTVKELVILCGQKKSPESVSCQKTIWHLKVPPTKFPEGFKPKEHGMIDICDDQKKC